MSDSSLMALPTPWPMQYLSRSLRREFISAYRAVHPAWPGGAPDRHLAQSALQAMVRERMLGLRHALEALPASLPDAEGGALQVTPAVISLLALPAEIAVLTDAMTR